jgi:hypothetical protein
MPRTTPRANTLVLLSIASETDDDDDDDDDAAAAPVSEA